MRASIKASLLGLGVAVTVIPVAAMIAFIKVMGADIAHIAGDEFKKSAIQSARQATVDIRQMCDVIQLSDENRMALARAAVMSALEELGEASLDRRVADRTIRSQSAPDTEQRRRLRLLKFGAETVDPAQPLEMPGNRIGETLLRLKKRLSCDFTIYQRISYDGDMLRVATTKTDENGKSLAGLYVPGLLRSGAKSRLADNILGGSEFSDTSDASGAPFLVGYMPVFDRRGEVIGAVNYGMRQDSKHEIEKYLQAFTIGQSGSVWVIDEAAPGGPTLRVTNDPSAEGMRIDDDPVAARRDFLKRALAKSKKMRSGEIDAELMIIPMGDGNKDAYYPEDAFRLVEKPKNLRRGSGIVVDGESGCEVKFAKCCNPLPGDTVIGFITKGFGISIHKADCPNVRLNREREEYRDRWVEAHWEGDAASENNRNLYEANLKVFVLDDIGVLAEGSAALADMKVSIMRISSHQIGDNGHAVINLAIGCRNVEHFKSIVSRLRSIPAVESVDRGFGG